MSEVAIPLAVLLRDIHVPPAPSLWPPAPGWSLLAAALLAATAIMLVLRWRRRRRHRAVLAMFDQHLHAATTPAAQLAAMSELLRRAARRHDPQADRLDGEAWLLWLDGKRGHDFSQGPGRALLDGPYRRDIDPQTVAALQPLVLQRLLDWMGVR